MNVTIDPQISADSNNVLFCWGLKHWEIVYIRIYMYTCFISVWGKTDIHIDLNNLLKSTSHITLSTINVTYNIWCKSFHIFTWSDQYHSLAALYTTHTIVHTAGSTLAWLLGYLLVSFLGFEDEGNLLFSPR